MRFGIIQTFDMSMEAMTTKLMWLLAQKTPYNRMKEKIQENMHGEIDNEMAKILLSGVKLN